MKIDKNYTNKIKKRKGANNRHADLIFGYFRKWDIDISDKWGRRLSGALLRLSKNGGYGIIQSRMGNADESLQYLKTAFPKKFEAIMSSNQSKQKYMWNKLLK